MKQSASNRLPGQSHTHTNVVPALDRELVTGRYLIDDLADHVFGRIVSTDLASDILHQFVKIGIVKVFEGPKGQPKDEMALVLDSEDVLCAIEQAFEQADLHDCIHLNAEDDAGATEPSSTATEGKAKQTCSKGSRGKKQKTYSFKWSTFPAKVPLNEDELVNFLNEITDRAFDFAQHKLLKDLKLKNRFTTLIDKHHAMPLSYEADGEEMRPDFVLLPAQAFSDDFKTVDPRYLNFTAARLVGEAKNADLAAGIKQVQRYARGMRRAQPWVHFVLAMTITKERVAFMRGEGSGTERVQLELADGRGCIEFIRILLGLALAEDVDLGQNPDVVLKAETRTCRIKHHASRSTPSNAPSSVTASRVTGTANAESIAGSSSQVVVSTAASDPPVSSRTRSATAAKRGALAGSNVALSSSRGHHARQQPPVATSSASSKRVYSEIGDDGHQARQQKKRKVAETAVEKREERVIFFPLYLYGHACLGLLFTSSSIRGRGTTVFCVVEVDDENTRLALKMSWQDLERLAEQNAVMERLTREDGAGEAKHSEGNADEDHRSEDQHEEGHPPRDNPPKGSPHPNVIVPIRCASSFIGYHALTCFPSQDVQCREGGNGVYNAWRDPRFSR